MSVASTSMVPTNERRWHDPHLLSRIAVLAALAIVGRVAFLWAPNVALTYFVVFLAGVLEGPLVGAAVGLVAMTVTNIMLSGLHPVLLANGPAMALFGLAGGWSRGLVLRPPRDITDGWLRGTTLFSLGLFMTFLFSVATDLVGFVMKYGATVEGRAVADGAFVPYMLMGLAFNLLPAVINGALFAGLTPALVLALERAGHMRPRPNHASPNAEA